MGRKETLLKIERHTFVDRAARTHKKEVAKMGQTEAMFQLFVFQFSLKFQHGVNNLAMCIFPLSLTFEIRNGCCAELLPAQDNATFNLMLQRIAGRHRKISKN